MILPSPTTFHAYDEIVNQPIAWKATLDQVQRVAPALRANWLAQPPQQVIFTGCGSTYFLARATAAFFQQTLGLPAIAYPASDLVLFPDMVFTPGIDCQLVTLSRSGETTETIKAVEVFRARGNSNIINITCYGEMPLARGARLTLEAQQAHEVSLAQTRSFVSMLIAALGYTLITANRPLDGSWLKLPEFGKTLIKNHHARARELGQDLTLSRFYFLGSGPFYGLACEGMLKMKEMSLSETGGFHFLEFRHGPKSMVNDHTLVIGLVSEQAAQQEADVLAEMRQLGGRVLAITPVPLTAEQADDQVLLPSGLSDMERAPLYLPVLQLLAFYRALHNGCNPDKPTNLTMVIKLKLD